MTANGRMPANTENPTVGFALSDTGRNVTSGKLEIEPQRHGDGSDVPLVSCLMVTRDRPHLAARAIECFLAQSYPNRELVVIDGSESDDLQQGIEAICYPPIKSHRERQAGRSMGELRDLAVDKASGQYVCIWDDDDLYDPDRLSIQMKAITTLAADACFLTRLQLWWPARRILAFSIGRLWEGTMICAREKMPLYPPLPRGEDTPVAYRLWRSTRVVMLDEPRLYTYVFHGANTTGESHFAAHCGAATQQWTGDAYTQRLAALGARVPTDMDKTAPKQSDSHEARSSPSVSAAPTPDIMLSTDTR